MSDAIIYSYSRDLRFVTLVCAILGFSAWWGLAPWPLLEHPDTLWSPDLGSVFQLAKATFTDHVCSTHHVSSPCECGEPLNRTTRALLEKPSFDPLGLNPIPISRVEALSVFVGCILLILVLSESVSDSGLSSSKFFRL